MTFKSFASVREYLQTFEQQKREAIKRDEESRAWRWFERSLDYRNDYVVSSLRRVHSHGRKGSFLTMAPVMRRRQREEVRVAA